MNKTRSSLLVVGLLCAGIGSLATLAQDVAPPIEAPAVVSAPAAASFTLPTLVKFGQPFTLGEQVFLITTNDQGAIIASTIGPNGTNAVMVPTTISDVFDRAKTMVQNNNPANVGFYGSNEWTLSVGGVFAQNSGSAAAQLAIEKYGLFKKLPQFGLGAAVLEGNQAGQSGTAAAYGFVDYRRPIGDVAFSVGLGAGYDNYTSRPMGIAKIEVEYRQNKHLGEYVGVGYDFEGVESKVKIPKAPSINPSGIIIGGGIRYAF